MPTGWRVQRRFINVQALLKPDRITATDRAGAHYGSIHADVDLVMLSGRAEDSRIRREVSLRQSGHHAAPTRTGNVETPVPMVRVWRRRSCALWVCPRRWFNWRRRTRRPGGAFDEDRQTARVWLSSFHRADNGRARWR